MYGQQRRRQARDHHRIINCMRASTMLDHIDLFKQQVPSFNIRGRHSISSWPGGLMSFFIFFVIMIYGALKFVMLMSKGNPNVSTYLE